MEMYILNVKINCNYAKTKKLTIDRRTFNIHDIVLFIYFFFFKWAV